MSRFAHLDKRKTAVPALAADPQPEPASKAQSIRAARPVTVEEPAAPTRAPAARAKAREGKTPVIGYFSPELRRELHIISATEGVTMQALLGEAIDLLMTDRKRNRFNER